MFGKCDQAHLDQTKTDNVKECTVDTTHSHPNDTVHSGHTQQDVELDNDSTWEIDNAKGKLMEFMDGAETQCLWVDDEDNSPLLDPVTPIAAVLPTTS